MGPSPAQCDGAQFENQNNVPLPAEGGGFHRASSGLWRTERVRGLNTIDIYIYIYSGFQKVDGTVAL